MIPQAIAVAAFWGTKELVEALGPESPPWWRSPLAAGMLSALVVIAAFTEADARYRHGEDLATFAEHAEDLPVEFTEQQRQPERRPMTGAIAVRKAKVGWWLSPSFRTNRGRLCVVALSDRVVFARVLPSRWYQRQVWVLPSESCLVLDVTGRKGVEE